MSGYLEGYGAGEDQRERIIKRVVLAVVSVAVLGAVAWFLFRNYREEKQVAAFLELLRNKDYQAAYGLWGCSETTPCREYPFDKFLEDWGPKSQHADLSAMRPPATIYALSRRSCRGGIIKTLEFPQDKVLLWVERKDLTLGYAPWPVCNPRIPAPL